MGRARRARRIAQTAAYGGGVGVAGLGAIGALSYGVLRVEAALTRRIVGQRFEAPPVDAGRYGSGPGEPIRLVMLGDSTAAGLGSTTRTRPSARRSPTGSRPSAAVRSR